MYTSNCLCITFHKPIPSGQSSRDKNPDLPTILCQGSLLSLPVYCSASVGMRVVMEDGGWRWRMRGANGIALRHETLAFAQLPIRALWLKWSVCSSCCTPLHDTHLLGVLNVALAALLSSGLFPSDWAARPWPRPSCGIMKTSPFLTC